MELGVGQINFHMQPNLLHLVDNLLYCKLVCARMVVLVVFHLLMRPNYNRSDRYDFLGRKWCRFEISKASKGPLTFLTGPLLVQGVDDHQPEINLGLRGFRPYSTD